MNSVCRRRSVGSKLCAKMLSELCALCERKNSPACLKNVLFLTENTDEQNTQRPTETLSQPITQSVTANRGLTPSPSPNGEGSDHRDTPVCPPYDSYVFSSYQQANRGNLSYYSPLHSERGWGWGLCEFCMPEAFCGFEIVRQKVLLNLWDLWEKEMSFVRDKTPHTTLQYSFSHRRTLKNRTHRVQKDDGPSPSPSENHTDFFPFSIFFFIFVAIYCEIVIFYQ